MHSIAEIWLVGRQIWGETDDKALSVAWINNA